MLQLTRTLLAIQLLLDRGEEIFQNSLQSLRGDLDWKTKLGMFATSIRDAIWPWVSAYGSRRKIRKELSLGKVSLHERISRLAYQLATVPRSIAVFLFLCCAQLAIAILFPSGSDTDGSGLLTMGEVTSGVAGIVVAVVIFGIQFHGEREGTLAFLVPAFARRLGVLPITAACLSVIAANVICGLWLASFVAGSASTLAMLNCVSIVIIVAALIWLVAQSTTSIGGDQVEAAYLPALSYIAEKVRIDIVRGQHCKAILDSALSKRGIAFELGYTEDCDQYLLFTKTLSGPIADINLSKLETWFDSLKINNRMPDIILGLELGSSEFSIYWPTSSKVSGDYELLALNSCVVFSHDQSELQMLERLNRHLAEPDCAESSRQFFDCARLVEWAHGETAHEIAPLQFDWNFHAHALIENAWDSSESLRIRTLVRMVYRLVTQRKTEFAFGSQIVESLLYKHCLDKDRFTFIPTEIDDLLGYLFSESQLAFTSGAMGTSYQLDVHKQRVVFGIRLAKLAVEFGNTDLLVHILERVFNDGRFQIQYRRNSTEQLFVASEFNTAAAFGILGWTTKLIVHDELPLASGLPIFKWMSSYFRSQREIVERWIRLTESHEEFEWTLAELSCKSWHNSTSQRRSLIPYGTIHPQAWFEYGFFAMGLMLPVSEIGSSKLTGRSLTISIALEKTLLDLLSRSSWFDAGQIGISNTELDRREAGFIELLAFYRKAALVEDFRRVLRGPLDHSRLTRLEDSASVAVERALDMFSDIQPASGALTEPTYLEVSFPAPRICFLTNGNDPLELLIPLENECRSALIHWLLQAIMDRTRSVAEFDLENAPRLAKMVCDSNGATILLATKEVYHAIEMDDQMIELLVNDVLEMYAIDSGYGIDLAWCNASMLLEMNEVVTPELALRDLDAPTIESLLQSSLEKGIERGTTMAIRIPLVMKFACPLAPIQSVADKYVGSFRLRDDRPRPMPGPQQSV